MPDQPKFTVKPTVRVNDSPRPDLDAMLEQVIVDQHLHQPDMFAIRLRDGGEHDVLSRNGVEIGARISIATPALGDQPSEPLFTGEVTALEAEYDHAGSHAVARGYDPAHRLLRGRRTRAFKNVKDSDIARQVAVGASLQIGGIDESQTVHDHVSQVNLSDWDFLKARAREAGFEMFMAAGKFCFQKPKEASHAPAASDLSSTDPLQLVLGQDLLEFSPRVTSSEQVSEVHVRGWDPKQKAAVVGTATASTVSAQLRDRPGAIAARFDAQPHVTVDRPLSSQSEVDTAAKAIAEQVGSAFAEAEGLARGNPHLTAGTAVSVGLVAESFVGRYTLTRARHIFDDLGYRTRFTVSGRQERSLLGLVSLGASNGAASAGGPPVNGVVNALVTDNKDPDEAGRVKLKFPWLSDDYESDWARLAQLGAGPQSGAVFIPEVGDEVLVAFEFGDVRRPYVIGGLYNGKDKPRLGDGLFDHGKVKRRGFVSRRGHRIVLLDDDGKSGIALITSDGKLKVALKETDSTIHISCQGKVTIESQQSMSLKSQQDITIEAQTNLSLKGNAGLTAESSAITEIKGSMVKIN
jgi:phage protein D